MCLSVSVLIDLFNVVSLAQTIFTVKNALMLISTHQTIVFHDVFLSPQDYVLREYETISSSSWR